MNIEQKIEFIARHHGELKNREIAKSVGMSEIWVKNQISKLLLKGVLKPKTGAAERAIQKLKDNNTKILMKPENTPRHPEEETEQSTRKGLRPGWTRYSIIMREDYLRFLKCLSNHLYTPITYLVDEAFGIWLSMHRKAIEEAWPRFVTMNNCHDAQSPIEMEQHWNESGYPNSFEKKKQ